MKLDCLNVKGFKPAEEATIGYIYEKEDNPEEYFQIAYAANGNYCCSCFGKRCRSS